MKLLLRGVLFDLLPVEVLDLSLHFRRDVGIDEQGFFSCPGVPRFFADFERPGQIFSAVSKRVLLSLFIGLLIFTYDQLIRVGLVELDVLLQIVDF